MEVGPTQIRLGGCLGVTGIYRSTNSGGSSGTSFGVDTVRGHTPGKNVSEVRSNTQSSRISMRVDSDFPEAETRFDRICGLLRDWTSEGSTPGTVAVTSTSFGLRMRQGFAEVNVPRVGSCLPPVKHSPSMTAHKGSTEHLAFGCRIVASSRHQLPGRHDLNRSSRRFVLCGARRSRINWAVLTGESGTADRQGP